MAKTATHVPGHTAADPAAQRLTMTQAELNDTVQRAVAAAMANLGMKPKVTAPTVVLPTLDEAKLMASQQVLEGQVPHPIETDQGHYVHPLVGASVEQLEADLLRVAKKQAAKKHASAPAGEA